VATRDTISSTSTPRTLFVRHVRLADSLLAEAIQSSELKACRPDETCAIDECVITVGALGGDVRFHSPLRGCVLRSTEHAIACMRGQSCRSHVHVLFTVMPVASLGNIIGSWKALYCSTSQPELSEAGHYGRLNYWDRFIKKARHNYAGRETL